MIAFQYPAGFISAAHAAVLNHHPIYANYFQFLRQLPRQALHEVIPGIGNLVNVAAARGCSDLVAWLTSQGVPFNVVDANGLSPIQVASWRHDAATYNILAARHAEQLQSLQPQPQPQPQLASAPLLATQVRPQVQRRQPLVQPSVDVHQVASPPPCVTDIDLTDPLPAFVAPTDVRQVVSPVVQAASPAPLVTDIDSAAPLSQMPAADSPFARASFDAPFNRLSVALVDPDSSAATTRHQSSASPSSGVSVTGSEILRSKLEEIGFQPIQATDESQNSSLLSSRWSSSSSPSLSDATSSPASSEVSSPLPVKRKATPAFGKSSVKKTSDAPWRVEMRVRLQLLENMLKPQATEALLRSHANSFAKSQAALPRAWTGVNAQLEALEQYVLEARKSAHSPGHGDGRSRHVNVESLGALVANAKAVVIDTLNNKNNAAVATQKLSELVPAQPLSPSAVRVQTPFRSRQNPLKLAQPAKKGAFPSPPMTPDSDGEPNGENDLSRANTGWASRPRAAHWAHTALNTKTTSNKVSFREVPQGETIKGRVEPKELVARDLQRQRL